MEYVFGSVKIEGELYPCLKTKDTVHSNFSGHMSTRREYDDSIITDTFDIVKKYNSSEDAEGNCYDWYVIKNHNTDTDKYTPNINKVTDKFDELINNIENAICGGSINIAKIWRNRIEAKDQLFDDCPSEYTDQVLTIMRQDVVDEIITAEEFKELTGQDY